jgi:hypothetical protein
MAQSTQQYPWQYRPGEVVVAVQLPEDQEQHRQSHALVGQAVETHLAGRTGGVFHPVQRRPEPIVFRARGRAPLGFLFYDLAQPDAHAPVKEVVSGVLTRQADVLAPLGGAGITPVGVMPHWLGSAQVAYGDGSPASVPRPTAPPGDGRWRFRYTPRDPALDGRARLRDTPAAGAVSVLVLDTAPRWGQARRQAEYLADRNGSLPEVFDLLDRHPLQDWHAAAARGMREDGLELAPSPDGRAHEYDMSDHGLFVAGLIHDLAPHADLRLRPVLNPRGVGDLQLLLRVLADEVARKDPDVPLVINMSLAFAPKLEHLPWMWYGVKRPNDPEFVDDSLTADVVRYAGWPAHADDRAWLARHRDEVEQTTRLLHSGIDQLARYLLANNCLGVAAAGNDSRKRVEGGRPRLGPRVPARYESVLGVAATTGDPSQAASYSNAGGDLEFGDHIATFGGEVTASNEPEDGVVGLYSAPTFPGVPGGTDGSLTNETGWATWSGTSFATAIASGLVAGYWAEQGATAPGMHAEAVLLQFNTLARDYAPALRTPSIAVEGAWERC